MNHTNDILDLTATAIAGWDRQQETGLTARVAEILATNTCRNVWCASSPNGAGKDLSKRYNVFKTHTGVRDNDLAHSRSFDHDPAVIVQYKYGREQSGTNPFLDGLSDLVYAGVEFRRLQERSRCHVVSVVHEVCSRRREWRKFSEASEPLVWTLECEPSKVSSRDDQAEFVFEKERLIKPNTVSRVCRVFGTKFQQPGYGLFARPGKFTLTFASRYKMVEEFAVIDWWVLDTEFTGANDGVTLETWLP